MKVSVKIHQPFGPYVLETDCPKYMVDSINRKTEEVCSNKREKMKYSSHEHAVPNLLARDLEVVYFEEKFLEEIGFKAYIEKLANHYIGASDNADKLEYLTDSESLRLSLIDEDPHFKHRKSIRYSDAWVNRYYKGDYTPIHSHGSVVAGVLLLKIPDDQEELQESDLGLSYDNETRTNGLLQYVYGAEYSYSEQTWEPDQYAGKIILFPNWLAHLVYPMKSTKERRTMSFNLITQEEYIKRCETLGDYE